MAHHRSHWRRQIRQDRRGCRCGSVRLVLLSWHCQFCPRPHRGDTTTNGQDNTRRCNQENNSRLQISTEATTEMQRWLRILTEGTSSASMRTDAFITMTTALLRYGHTASRDFEYGKTVHRPGPLLSRTTTNGARTSKKPWSGQVQGLTSKPKCKNGDCTLTWMILRS